MKLEVGLIKGRHEMPVSSYIFEEIEDVFAFQQMEETILEFLEREVGIELCFGVGINQHEQSDVQVFSGKAELIVYVTGLTAATAALVATCARNGVRLTLMHYDTASGIYRAQSVL